METQSPSARSFFGWRVVAGAFVLAVFGWGLGFYGPPVYMHAVREANGWSVTLVSAAVTVHYLVGAAVVANLPKLYGRFGLPAITRCGALVLALGLVGWAAAREPWQLFAATVLSGAGWVAMGAAAINAIVSPWFVRQRPKALSTAYNGASIGGVVFAPLLVFLIGRFGFQSAAVTVGLLCLGAVWWMTAAIFGKSPASLGQQPDGEDGPAAATAAVANAIAPLPGALLRRNWKFRTLALGMALGLFAQIGLIAHLFSLVVPALGAQWAGIATGLATASAIAGRTAFGWLMPAGADRRRMAASSYAIQILGVFALIASGMQAPRLIVLGIVLFGFGIGNATSLPPLIAQVEFAREDTSRVVALIVAIGQASYAFAPAAFGLVRGFAHAEGPFPAIEANAMFACVIAIKLVAIAAYLWGRRR